jgi:hypothetical protein
LTEIYNQKYTKEYGEFSIRFYQNIIDVTIPYVKSQIDESELLKTIKPGTILNIFLYEGDKFIDLKNKILLEKSFKLQKLKKCIGSLKYIIHIVQGPNMTKRALQQK